MRGSAACGTTACCRKQLIHRNQAKEKITDCVDNLRVNGTLLTNMQLGGTLTLNGSGTPQPEYEAALWVKAGARVDGLSQHGRVHVLGTSCLEGPASVHNLYGPVTVSADPLGDTTETPQLSVVGGSLIDESIVTGNSTILGDEAVLNDFSVQGYLSGVPAAGTIAARVSPAVFIVQVDATPPVDLQHAVAITPTYLVMPLTSAPVDYTYYVCSLDGTTAGNASVKLKYPGYNLQVIELSVGIGANAVVNLAVEDTPPRGMPAVLLGANSLTGAATGQETAITDPSLNVFDRYTSLTLALPPGVDNWYMGAPVFNYRGELLGTLQTGTAGDATPVVSIIKARYHQFVLSTASAFAVSPVGVPFIESSRGIALTERLSNSSLTAGGVTTTLTAGGADIDNQLLTVYFDGDTSPATSLGTKGPNNPSLPDILVQYALNNQDTWLGTQSNLLYTSQAGSSISYTPDGSPYNLWGAGVWTNTFCAPSSLTPGPTCPTVGQQSSVFTHPASDAGTLWISTSSLQVVIPELINGLGSLTYITQAVPIFTSVYVVWGGNSTLATGSEESANPVDKFITGLGGAAKAAWQSWVGSNNFYAGVVTLTWDSTTSSPPAYVVEGASLTYPLPSSLSGNFTIDVSQDALPSLGFPSNVTVEVTDSSFGLPTPATSTYPCMYPLNDVAFDVGYSGSTQNSYLNPTNSLPYNITLGSATPTTANVTAPATGPTQIVV